MVGDGLGLAVLVWPDVFPGSGSCRPDGVVLVHGLASNARLWDGVATELARRDHPVAAIDLRGHGRSDKPDGGHDGATVADDVALVVDALGWSRPAVVGQSWGGNVVVELAHRHPEAVAPRRRHRRWHHRPPAPLPVLGRSAPVGSRHRRWPGPRGPTLSAVCAVHTRTGLTKGSTAARWPASVCGARTAPLCRG